MKTNRFQSGLLLLVGAACVGCSDAGDPLGPVANVSHAMQIRRALGGSEEAAAEGAEADAGTGWATLRGRFIFEGSVPERPAKLAALTHSDASVCAPGGEAPRENDIVVGEGGGLQYVAVYLRRAPGNRVHESASTPPDEPFVFDQKNCVFQEHVFACQVGQTVVLQNSDPVGHNAKIEGKARFNQTIQANDSLSYEFAAEEAAPQPVSCSIHPWMRAFALPRENGYYAVTAPDGSFQIANLPAGVELEFQAWHERGRGTGGGLALDTPEAQQLDWNARGRFTIKLEENQEREIVIHVPPTAVGL